MGYKVGHRRETIAEHHKRMVESIDKAKTVTLLRAVAECRLTPAEAELLL